jgi:EAL domain-containing protein (putative c-di-GMP-specific phosphodiesterase class I)
VFPALDFMAAVEQQQLGREIDCAALQLGLMAMQRNPQIRVSVNMSARSVGYRPWIDILRRALQDSPKLGANLILEINEASALQVPDVLKPFMADMREHGIVFALDDFGAGMTSLSLSPGPQSPWRRNWECTSLPRRSKPRERRTGFAMRAPAACRATSSARRP